MNVFNVTPYIQEKIHLHAANVIKSLVRRTAASLNENISWRNPRRIFVIPYIQQKIHLHAANVINSLVRRTAASLNENISWRNPRRIFVLSNENIARRKLIYICNECI